MNHFCPDCHAELKPVTPEYTGATVTRLRCPECGETYRVITPTSATENERIERDTVSFNTNSAGGGRAVHLINRHFASG